MEMKLNKKILKMHMAEKKMEEIINKINEKLPRKKTNNEKLPRKQTKIGKIILKFFEKLNQYNERNIEEILKKYSVNDVTEFLENDEEKLLDKKASKNNPWAVENYSKVNEETHENKEKNKNSNIVEKKVDGWEEFGGPNK